jgi:sulfur carrier protein
LLIQVNGEPQEVNDGLALTELISHLKLRADQIAIELNQQVLRRSLWEATILLPDDRIEIVHFVGGG